MFKIGSVLREIITRLSGVHRWQIFSNKKYNENVVGHSLETAFLAIIMISLEEQNGRKKFDKFRVLASAVLHDLAEMVLTDIPWEIKNDPRIKKGLLNIEKELFAKILRKFPEEVRLSISSAHNLQYDKRSFESKLFSAVENLGYVCYAWEEYERGNESFIKVFKNQHLPIMKLVPEVKSLAILYRPYLKEILPLLELTEEEKQEAKNYLKEG